MLNPQSMPPRLFDLEGTFIDFLGENPRKPKSIVLEVEQEQMAIRLPKELRIYAQGFLQPGDRIRCVGRSEVDFKAGVIKLQAYQIFSLASAAETASPTRTAATDSTNHGQSPVPSRSELPQSLPAANQKRGKIVICHKSGCQKRGGRQIAAALEQALRDHQLQDQVDIQYTGCQKRCSKAPSLTIMPGKHRYECLNPKSVSALIEEHFCTPESRSTPSHVDP